MSLPTWIHNILFSIQLERRAFVPCLESLEKSVVKRGTTVETCIDEGGAIRAVEHRFSRKRFSRRERGVRPAAKYSRFTPRPPLRKGIPAVTDRVRWLRSEQTWAYGCPTDSLTSCIAATNEAPASPYAYGARTSPVSVCTRRTPPARSIEHRVFVVSCVGKLKKIIVRTRWKEGYRWVEKKMINNFLSKLMKFWILFVNSFDSDDFWLLNFTTRERTHSLQSRLLTRWES